MTSSGFSRIYLSIFLCLSLVACQNSISESQSTPGVRANYPVTREMVPAWVDCEQNLLIRPDTLNLSCYTPEKAQTDSDSAAIVLNQLGEEKVFWTSWDENKAIGTIEKLSSDSNPITIELNKVVPYRSEQEPDLEIEVFQNIYINSQPWVKTEE